jgi:hypothetical protein
MVTNFVAEWSERFKCGPRQMPCFNSYGRNCSRKRETWNQRRKKERGTLNRRVGKGEGVL